jgi:hypothetical protein
MSGHGASGGSDRDEHRRHGETRAPIPGQEDERVEGLATFASLRAAISEVESKHAACGGDDSVGMTATAASTSAASKPSEGPHAGSGDDTAVVGGPTPDGNPVAVLLCYTPPEAEATLQIVEQRSKEVKESYHFRNYHEVRCGPSPLPHRRCHAKPPWL